MNGTPGQLSFGAMTAETWLDRPANAADELGEVFTRRWVVDLILDLAGYTSDRDLAAMVAVEPSCGRGAFLVPIVERLVESCAKRGTHVSEAAGAIRGFDIIDVNVKAARAAIVDTLVSHGVAVDEASLLADRWVVEGDFLLQQYEPDTADFVLGNPPYIRLEDVPAWRSAAYREACPTMRGRSDVFVGFIERGLRLLRTDGVLGYIVADRWMRNQYGASLRTMISGGFAVDAVLQLHDVDAFEEQVSAYPAVTIMRRGAQGPAIIAETVSGFAAAEATAFARWKDRPEGSEFRGTTVRAARLPGWFDGQASWPTGSLEQLRAIAELEARFAPIEDPSGHTRVGIGVASGADSVYLTKDSSLVEPDRLMPLVLAKDTAGGVVSWSGTYLVNPWHEGRLVDLPNFPRLRRYLSANGGVVRSRHVAERNPRRWYRTIDRVEPGLRETPKLLLPDLKASIHPVLEDGNLYPHHNLYFVTSKLWDLEVLGGLLLSDVANLFVGAYCVKMRGGCYRFQAQYVRRIRVPQLDLIKPADRRVLASAFASRDVERATGVALRLYGLESLPVSPPMLAS